MKKFMVLYVGDVSDAEKAAIQMEDLKPKMLAWKNWAEKNMKSFVDTGGPLGKTTRVDRSGAHESKNHVGAYVIVEAESIKSAAKLFIGHPHLDFFKGNSIEIMECLPSPKV